MTKQERKVRIQTLLETLSLKYTQIDDNETHKRFTVQQQDIHHIANNYRDVLESSNVYISKCNEIGVCDYETTNYLIFCDSTGFVVTSNKQDRYNNFNVYIEFGKVMEIEVIISCEVIISFHFKYPNCGDRNDQFTFRSDLLL